MATTVIGFSSAAYPDATNTGVHSGVTLAPSGGLTITTPGAIVQGLDISGPVYIDAQNVTLKDCRIESSNYAVVKIASGATGAVVKNCEINGVGTNNAGDYGILGSGTFIGNNVYNVENGIVPYSNSVVENNYIHDLSASGSPHYDPIQIDGNVANVLIQHNTIINQYNETSAVMIDNYFGSISNITVNDNVLVGGGYTVYSYGNFNSSPVTGVSFTNNHMGRGEWGYTDFAGTNPLYQGNVDDATTLGLISTASSSPSTSSTRSSSTGAQPPTLTSVVETPSTGQLNAGKTVTLNLNMNETVTVAGGTPTLSLNDGGAASYVTGSGTSALSFNYTVAAGQNTASLVATAVNLNGATIIDSTGNSANLSLTDLTQTGPQIDTTPPTITLVATAQQGLEGTPIPLNLLASVQDNLPGANLTSLLVGSIPIGAVLSDRTNTFTASSGSTSVNVAGWNLSSLTITATNDSNVTLSVIAKAQDTAGNISTATATEAVTVKPLAPTVSIGGTAIDGHTLTAMGSTKDANATISYQWQSLTGSTWTNISGATSSTYVVGEADETHQLRVVAKSTDVEGNLTSAASSATDIVRDPTPTLIIANKALSVTAGGGAALGISVVADADDATSVTIRGLPNYETLTDNLDHHTFSGSSVTLSAAEVNSGLTLHSSYRGHSHPVATLTMTATNRAAGELGSTSQTMTVTDPPATSTRSNSRPPSPAGTIQEVARNQASLSAQDTSSLVALLNQHVAAEFIRERSASSFYFTPHSHFDEARVLATSTSRWHH